MDLNHKLTSLSILVDCAGGPRAFAEVHYP